MCKSAVKHLFHALVVIRRCITPNTDLELANILPAALEALDVPNKSLNAKTRDLNVVLQLSLDSVAPLKPRKRKDKNKWCTNH